MNFYHSTIEETFGTLGSRPAGLSHKEAETKHQEHGFNVLPEKKKGSRLILFFHQFRSVLVYILIIAGGVSMILGENIDATVIFASVIINVVVGFIQESRAQKALDALKKVITRKAYVLRNDREEELDASLLVPGDVIVLRPGDKIPADARLFESIGLKTSEASLTGESEARKKYVKPLQGHTALPDRNNMVFMGTGVLEGTGRAVVTTTGAHTEMGHIATLLKETKEDITPLQKKLAAFARSLGIIIVTLCGGIIAVGLIFGYTFFQIFETAVAIAVAAIPEGLAAQVTIVLAIGMQQILKRKGLVRKLVAAETLGSTTVICTDKTGTLTEGKMQVVKILTWDKDFIFGHSSPKNAALSASYEVLTALRIGTLCNDATIRNPEADFTQWVVIGNSTERALLVAGRLIGLDQNDLLKKEPRIAEIPFDSKWKFMVSQHSHSAKEDIFYIKGAPEKLIEVTTKILEGENEKTLTLEKKKQLIAKYEEMSKKGLRVLSLGYKKVNKGEDIKKTGNPPDGITWVGFVGIQDPLRKEAKNTIKVAQSAGMKVIMITGDNKLTAQAIAQELGLPAELENILEGEELQKLSEKELHKNIQNYTIYARVSPADKLRIVDAWQFRGEVVAMTGDGVNDAPALKTADIGVALGSGTEVAKETASLVLLDDNFKTIVAAVEIGRTIFDNLKKIILYLLSDAFSTVFLIIGGLFLQLPLPVLATQILWINLITDSLPAIALSADPMDRQIMNEPPQGLKGQILDNEMKILIGVVSFMMGCGTLLLFYLFWKQTGNIDLARTVAFTALAMNVLLYVYSIRSLRHNIWQTNLFSNIYLNIAILGGVILQLLAVYLPLLQKFLHTVPLGWTEWVIIIASSCGIMLIIEGVKYFFLKNKKTPSLIHKKE